MSQKSRSIAVKLSSNYQNIAFKWVKKNSSNEPKNSSNDQTDSSNEQKKSSNEEQKLFKWAKK